MVDCAIDIGTLSKPASQGTFAKASKNLSPLCRGEFGPSCADQPVDFDPDRNNSRSGIAASAFAPKSAGSAGLTAAKRAKRHDKLTRVRNPDTRDELADAFLQSTGADIREGGEAYYVPGADSISLPRFEAFKNADHFYSTAFHELGHWTGHKSRLARDLRHRFGERAYAAEELVAELCSAFLCAEFSIDGDLRHAGYIENWMGLLKADSRAFFTACSKASKAADYLRGLALAAPTEVAA